VCLVFFGDTRRAITNPASLDSKTTSAPMDLSWLDQACDLAKEWNTTAAAQLSHGSTATAVVHYEELADVRLRAAALARTAAFCGVPISAVRAACAFENAELARRIHGECPVNATCPEGSKEAFSLADELLHRRRREGAGRERFRVYPPKHMSLSTFVWETVRPVAVRAGYRNLHSWSQLGTQAASPLLGKL